MRLFASKNRYPTRKSFLALGLTTKATFSNSSSSHPQLRRILRPHSIQTKLTIGSPNDQYEREADRVADQIVRMPDHTLKRQPLEEEEEELQTKPIADQITPMVQRQIEEEEEEELIQPDRLPIIQRQEEEEEEIVQTLQRQCDEEECPIQTQQDANRSSEVTPNLASQIQAIRSGGRSLPQPCRNYFEPRFGRDFSDVHIHTDSKADDVAKSINAKAFTLGQDVFFGSGQFAPGTEGTKKLLAHELTHVVQQNSNILNFSNIIMRKQNPAEGTECKEFKGRWIKKIVVNQEGDQKVHLYWNDDKKSDTDKCSTGKGHCCVESDGIACSESQSRVGGSNCTPVSRGDGEPIQKCYPNRNGLDYWCYVDRNRGVALHTYPNHLVTGKPLSHGCIRLEKPTAKKIFCGAIESKTIVQVKGLAKPKCSDEDLKDEWRSDFSKAGAATDGEDTSLVMVQEAMGYRSIEELKEAVSKVSDVTSVIPRCLAPTATPAAPLAEIPTKIIESQGLDSYLKQFETELKSLGGYILKYEQAYQFALKWGKKLWYKARKLLKKEGSTYDDRPLYWTRKQMIEKFRQWRPVKFVLTETTQKKVIDIFDSASRGMTTAEFIDKAKSVKKILVSGFDPFALSDDVRKSNLSGAAAIALDHELITKGKISARIQGVVFPVSERFFDAGKAETFFRPFLEGEDRADMVIAMGMGAESEFEVEKQATKPRSSAGSLGLPGQTTGGSSTFPTTLGTTLPNVEEAMGRSWPGSEEMSAGSYLCNEIFYRVLLIGKQIEEGNTGESKVEVSPVGFLHTPLLQPPEGSEITSDKFEKDRKNIVNKIKEILTAWLPHLET
ncbi:hypothetical protein CEE37_12300 [candidate division LCP-89 bacterium B3_LCP]|uniref:L,D-TPase catalytic domain-containing protein n=1 Tax=candidate division LCP-89 bacterium B3_LCP TaxID=2012998 RepID=A0A532UUB5_UNCL8|nr:MAG: hypothetical protein CEE37_12300 [candidate division LCP-89 bacterium B3_LCP]